MNNRTPRRPFAWLLALATALATALLPAATAHAATVTFSPGASWTDQNGNPLQLHGLGIIKVGGTWYGFGEDKTGESSSDAYFQDIPCYSSTDLAHWTYQSKALTEQSSGDLGPSRIVERPKVIYNSSTGLYVMYMHIDNSSYSEAKVGVATSSSVCGPYTYRGSFQPLGYQSRDIGLFQDTGGTAYLLSEDRANGLRIDQLSSDYLSVVSAVHVFADYEAPAMVKIGSTYYIFGSHLTGWSTNDNVYATSTSLGGTWSSFSTFAPAGTNTYNSQTANIIPVQGSSGTAYVYAGDRWTTGNLGTSPLVWLPLAIQGTVVTAGWYNSWSLNLSAGTWTAGSSQPSAATHVLTNVHSGLVMDVSGSSTSNGGAVIQYTNTGGTNQRWTLHLVSGNVYTITNVNSGLCLDVPNNSTTEGLQLDQWTCNSGANQEWAFEAVGSYTSSSDADFAVVSLLDGYTAEVIGQSTSTGAKVDQWASNGGSNQEWAIS